MKFSKSLLFFAIFIIWKENRPVNANVFYVYLPITRAERVGRTLANGQRTGSTPKYPKSQNTQGQNTQCLKIPKIETTISIK